MPPDTSAEERFEEVRHRLAHLQRVSEEISQQAQEAKDDVNQLFSHTRELQALRNRLAALMEPVEAPAVA